VKKLLLAGIAVATILSVPAFAADMPVKAPMAPAFSWTGCYLGGNIGGGWARSDNGDATIGSSFGTNKPDGVVGGGQIGCDYQIGALVFGIRGLLDASDVKGSNIDPNNAAITTDQRFPWFYSATGRIGFTPQPAALIYLTGGSAWTRNEYSTNVGSSATSDATRQGWLVGGGAEYVFAPQWSVFGEYNHIDFGTKTTTTVGDVFSYQSKITENVVLFGVNYRFGGH
jgi:outer membrane immunogenic protein